MIPELSAYRLSNGSGKGEAFAERGVFTSSEEAIVRAADAVVAYRIAGRGSVSSLTRYDCSVCYVYVREGNGKEEGRKVEKRESGGPHGDPSDSRVSSSSAPSAAVILLN